MAGNSHKVWIGTVTITALSNYFAIWQIKRDHRSLNRDVDVFGWPLLIGIFEMSSFPPSPKTGVTATVDLDLDPGSHHHHHHALSTSVQF